MPASALPTIRLATPDDAPSIARVHVVSWQHTYAGLLPASFLDNLSIPDDARRWREAITAPSRRLFVHVAERPPGTIAGFAAGGRNHHDDGLYEGELQALYLDPSCQRQGIGTVLMRAVAAHLGELGMSSMIVWVLAGNPAYHFYEALGGRLTGQRKMELAGVTLEAIAYGWKDTTALRAK